MNTYLCLLKIAQSIAHAVIHLLNIEIWKLPKFNIRFVKFMEEMLKSLQTGVEDLLMPELDERWR